MRFSEQIEKDDDKDYKFILRSMLLFIKNKQLNPELDNTEYPDALLDRPRARTDLPNII